MNLRDKINVECRKKGWKQKDLAERLGKEQPNLHNQISNEDTVQLGLIKNICRELDIPLDTLLTDIDKGEGLMVHDQLDKIIAEGDEEAVDIILGKIAKEYINVQRLGKRLRSNGTK